MLKWLGAALVLVLSFAIAPVATPSASGANDRVRVFIDVPLGFNQSDRALLTGLGGDTRNVFTTSHSISVELPTTAVQQLVKLNRFFNVRPVPTMTVVDDSLAWAWGVDQIDAERVWGGAEDALNVLPGLPAGAGVKVAIIDSGIDRDHPDLVANIAGGRNWSYNNQTVSGGNCSGGTYDAANYEDEHGHGTHVAGTVAALDSPVNSSASVIGVAPKASIYALRALDKCGSGYMDDIAAAVEWASGLNGGTKADVISMSLGCFYQPQPDLCDDPVLRSAVNAAYSTYGVVVVAAAGNSGAGANTVGYPAMYDGAIAVSSTDSNNGLSSFSSTGPKVEIAAPGRSITSTYLNGAFATMSGTSMATPHVAGVAALVKSANPSLSASAIRAILQQTATDLGTAGRDAQFGFGLVDALDAVNAASPSAPPPPNPPPAVPTTNVWVSCGASAAATGGNNNGYETNPAAACADDSSYAQDNNSGTSSSTSCTSSARDRHMLSNFGVVLPAGQLVTGIQVRLDAWADSSSSSPAICVELSPDGGATWTVAKKTAGLTTSQRTYNLGGSTDTWGVNWGAASVSDANLRVRLTDVASSTSRDFRLDYVAINVATAAAPEPVYDIAVTGISASPSSPIQGTTSTVTVNLANQGNQSATGVGVSLTDGTNGPTIGTQTVNLNAGQSTSIDFAWNTTGASIGAHTLVAKATQLPGETNTGNNTWTTSSTVVQAIMDLAITSVSASPASVTVGGTSRISVGITNQGNLNASGAQLSFTDGIGGATLGSVLVNLNAGQSTTATFDWTTTGATLGAHAVQAVLAPLAGETDTSKNGGSTTVTVLAAPSGPVSTGYLGCTGSSPVTSNSGDNNGFESSGGSACADDSSYAQDNNSGTSSSTSCTSNRRDRHVYTGYNAVVPSGATIKGIQVRLDAWADSSSSSPRMCVEVSWNGGASWTAAKQMSSNLGTSQATYILGSTTDTWGRTWSTSDVANLAIRITTTGSSTSRDYRLDFAGVQVTYTSP